MNGSKKVLVMYDVRGIQNYVFRTPFIKDAIGASAIIKGIFENAIGYSIKKLRKDDKSFTSDLKWCDENGPVEYKDNVDTDFRVLYIGGGNACAVVKNRALAIRINKCMSKYIIENTYALQLAVAIIEKGDRYDQDYKKLNEEMLRIKAEMPLTSPVGALPIIKTEIRTGYPLTTDEESSESRLKKEREHKVRIIVPKDRKILDSLVTERGSDSQIAVVHIDGNNMGLRIRSLIQDKASYDEAVNAMRKVSFNISHAYKSTFDKMYDFFNDNSGSAEAFRLKEKNDIFLTPILVAGDDITYVCNAKIALASIEYYAKEISGLTMNGGNSPKDIQKYGFSVCGGAAFIGSHFPFNIGYDVAEACCGEAKKRAKKKEFKDGDRIGSWVDFQITRNVQARNLKDMREREYITPDGENLLLRPYYIPDGNSESSGIFKELSESEISFNSFRDSVQYFRMCIEDNDSTSGSGEKGIPRSYVKALRDSYPLGGKAMEPLFSFMRSRGMSLPDGSMTCRYIDIPDRKKTAPWYDSLEMADDYLDLSELQN